MPEHKIFGPPGCGKTSTTAHWLKQTVEKSGPESVIALSFTRAGAAELVGRNLPVPRERVGTLHSFGYRALGGGQIAEKQLLDEWNKAYPHYLISDRVTPANLDDLGYGGDFGATDGGATWAQYQILRSQMKPHAQWPPHVQSFHKAWADFKSETGAMDFLDMIEIPLREHENPPLSCQIMFVDEAQDHTVLEIALIRKWAQKMDNVVFALDDDQAIYGWRGATPEAVLYPDVPKEQKRVLAQSYRLPRKIVRYAQQWIQQVQLREPKEYAPRAEDGEIHIRPSLTLESGQVLVELVEQELACQRSVMVLASCAYMLRDVIASLRSAGALYHNPYRSWRGDWNPLNASKGTSFSRRLLDYLGPYLRGAEPWWTASETKHWIHLIASEGVLQRGAKGWAEKLKGDDPLALEIMSAQFLGDELIAALRAACAGDISWLEAHILNTQRKALQYPKAIIEKSGVEALQKKPSVVVGTIHSVKGGEVDTVILAPDLSPSGYREWCQSGPAHDAIIRCFYVGMTRARQKLVILGATSHQAVHLPTSLPKQEEVVI